MQEILNYLKQRGERLDSEIAEETGIPLADVRLRLSELSKRGEIIQCHSTRFRNGKKSEGMLCRLAGCGPASSPLRKKKTK